MACVMASFRVRGFLHLTMVERLGLRPSKKVLRAKSSIAPIRPGSWTLSSHENWISAWRRVKQASMRRPYCVTVSEAVCLQLWRSCSKWLECFFSPKVDFKNFFNSGQLLKVLRLQAVCAFPSSCEIMYLQRKPCWSTLQNEIALSQLVKNAGRDSLSPL